MRYVFEPAEIDLGDARTTPNRVFEIQKKVEEYLSPGINIHRRDELKEQILQEKAWALPGLINATLVYQNHMESEDTQKEIAEMMIGLAGDNQDAQRLIFRSGVIQNPFPTSRQIALRALRQLAWKPGGSEQKEIAEMLRQYRKQGNLQGQLHLYELYFRSGQNKAYREGVEVCEEWIKARYLDEAKELLTTLLISFPQHCVEILSSAFLAVIEISRDARKDRDFSQELVDAIPKNLFKEWVYQEDNPLITITLSVLKETEPPRHKAIELLWVSAVQVLKRDTDWETRLSTIQSSIQNEVRNCSNNLKESFLKYWMEAISKAGGGDFIIRQVDQNDRLLKEAAALQLFFLNSKNAKQTLEDLKINEPGFYEAVRGNYENIKSSKRAGSIRRNTPKGPGELA